MVTISQSENEGNHGAIFYGPDTTLDGVGGDSTKKTNMYRTNASAPIGRRTRVPLLEEPIWPVDVARIVQRTLFLKKNGIHTNITSDITWNADRDHAYVDNDLGGVHALPVHCKSMILNYL